MNMFSILLVLLMGLFQGKHSLPNSQMAKAFEKNDASMVVHFAQDKLLLGIEGDESVYSKAQAQQVLQKFFDAHKNGTFSYSFEGDAKQETTFTVGEYLFKEKPYRITVQYRVLGDSYKIESLSVE